MCRTPPGPNCLTHVQYMATRNGKSKGVYPMRKGKRKRPQEESEGKPMQYCTIRQGSPGWYTLSEEEIFSTSATWEQDAKALYDATRYGPTSNKPFKSYMNDHLMRTEWNLQYRGLSLKMDHPFRSRVHQAMQRNDRSSRKWENYSTSAYKALSLRIAALYEKQQLSKIPRAILSTIRAMTLLSPIITEYQLAVTWRFACRDLMVLAVVTSISTFPLYYKAMEDAIGIHDPSTEDREQFTSMTILDFLKITYATTTHRMQDIMPDLSIYPTWRLSVLAETWTMAQEVMRQVKKSGGPEGVPKPRFNFSRNLGNQFPTTRTEAMFVTEFVLDVFFDFFSTNRNDATEKLHLAVAQKLQTFSTTDKEAACKRISRVASTHQLLINTENVTRRAAPDVTDDEISRAADRIISYGRPILTNHTDANLPTFNSSPQDSDSTNEDTGHPWSETISSKFILDGRPTVQMCGVHPMPSRGKAREQFKEGVFLATEWDHDACVPGTKPLVIAYKNETKEFYKAAWVTRESNDRTAQLQISNQAVTVVPSGAFNNIKHKMMVGTLEPRCARLCRLMQKGTYVGPPLCQRCRSWNCRRTKNGTKLCSYCPRHCVPLLLIRNRNSYWDPQACVHCIKERELQRNLKPRYWNLIQRLEAEIVTLPDSIITDLKQDVHLWVGIHRENTMDGRNPKAQLGAHEFQPSAHEADEIINMLIVHLREAQHPTAINPIPPTREPKAVPRTSRRTKPKRLVVQFNAGLSK